MSRPAPPALTIRYDGSTRTFAAGSDVVIGRDLRADVRIAHPLISRAHLVLRFDQGRWVAIDNGSLNGMYINGRRVPAVDIQDGQQINIGNPDGPGLTFEVGRHQGSVGMTPKTMTVSLPPRSGSARPSALPPTGRPPVHAPSTSRPSTPQPMYPAGYPSAPQPRYPSAPQSARAGYPPSRSQPARSGALSQPALESVTAMGPTAAPRSTEGNLATSMLKILRPGRTAEAPAGSVKIGRATDNDIVIPDVLASRHHATLVPGPSGTEIRDERSINGTFVNGARVDSKVLSDGDVVTIGNVDLVFRGGALARRTETEADTRTGGLDVHGITWTIEGNKTLLDNISVAARPGTLTAVIGPSGAGKSTFARLVAGYTHPTTGTVSFEGHDIHAEYASLRSRIGMVPQDDVVHGQLTVNQALITRPSCGCRPTPRKGPPPGRRAGARGTRDDPACRHPCRQAVRRSAQARIGGDGAADRSVAADPRRADLRPGPCTGPAGDDDAAPAGRRRPRGARGHALADLSRRVRPGAAAGAGRQDRVLRAAESDRPVHGDDQLGRHLQHGRGRPR